MERFVHEQNLSHLRKVLSEATDESKQHLIQTLIAEEEARSLTSISGADSASPQDDPSAVNGGNGQT